MLSKNFPQILNQMEKMVLLKWPHTVAAVLVNAQCSEDEAGGSFQWKKLKPGFFGFIARQLPKASTVSVRGSGAPSFCGGRVQGEGDLERILLLFGRVSICSVRLRWLAWILDYSRPLLHHYRFFLLLCEQSRFFSLAGFHRANKVL